MHMRQRSAEIGAFRPIWKPAPGAVKKGEYGTGAPGKLLQDGAVTRRHGERTVKARIGKHFHDFDEEGKVRALNALFIQGQNVMRPVGAQQIVGVLDAFGDSGKTQNRSKIIGRQEFGERRIIDIGVNRHEASRPRLPGWREA